MSDRIICNLTSLTPCLAKTQWMRSLNAKVATPVLLKQRSGSILNISSIGSDVGWTFNAAYSAGKFAPHGYSEAVRR
jgi:short-subunit dehydrogenase